jgi:hypothetical protein
MQRRYRETNRSGGNGGRKVHTTCAQLLLQRHSRSRNLFCSVHRKKREGREPPCSVVASEPGKPPADKKAAGRHRQGDCMPNTARR